jgi:hypothetical protein
MVHRRLDCGADPDVAFDDAWQSRTLVREDSAPRS